MYTQVEQDQDERKSAEVEPDVQDGLVGALARALASRRPMCVDSGENQPCSTDCWGHSICCLAVVRPPLCLISPCLCAVCNTVDGMVAVCFLSFFQFALLLLFAVSTDALFFFFFFL